MRDFFSKNVRASFVAKPISPFRASRASGKILEHWSPGTFHPRLRHPAVDHVGPARIENIMWWNFLHAALTILPHP